MIFPHEGEIFTGFLGRCYQHLEKQKSGAGLEDQEIELLSRSAWQKMARKAKENPAARSHLQGFQRDLLVLDDEIYFYGVIGSWDDEIGFENVQHAVQSISGDRITIRLNSTGGDIMEGIAIMRYLRRLDRPIDTYVDSQALSMGAIIAMLGEDRTVSLEGRLMIHHGHTIAMGDYRDFRREAEILEGLSQDMVRIIEGSSNMEPDAIWKALDEETWYTAEDALENGMATAVERTPLSGDQFNNLSPKQWQNLNRAGFQGMRYTEEVKKRVAALRRAIS